MENKISNDFSYRLKSPFKAYDGDDDYIFISYKHKDSSIVYPVIKQFHDAGFNVWYDDGLPKGRNYDIQIAHHIKFSSLFVNFITKESMACANDDEDYMIKEFNIARNFKKNILPIYLEDVELDGYYLVHILGIQSIFKKDYDGDENLFIKACTDAFEEDFNLKPNFEDIKESQIVSENISGLNYEDTVEKNFKFLDNLIHSGRTTIVLEEDILFCDDEGEYEYGIELNVDNMVIDGQGHIIDAKNKVRIFDVSSNNVFLKNIRFKNANYSHDGGAISVRHIASLNLDSCEFENNYSNGDGGAIANHGMLKISNSKFANNTCKKWGGAIKNISSESFDEGMLEISNSQFVNNDAWDGGAIANWGDISIDRSYFDKNHVTDSAGALLNFNRCKIKNTIFNQNVSNANEEMDKNGGGAIFNHTGKIDISYSEFTDNLSKRGGGVIFNYNGPIKIQFSEFKNNKSVLKGYSLNNRGKKSVSIFNSKFGNAKTDEIYSEYENAVECDNTIFEYDYDYFDHFTEAVFNVWNIENKNKDFSEISNQTREYYIQLAIKAECIAMAVGGEIRKKDSHESIVLEDFSVDNYDVFKKAQEYYIEEMTNRGWVNGKYDYSNKTIPLSPIMGTFASGNEEKHMQNILKAIKKAGYVFVKETN